MVISAGLIELIVRSGIKFAMFLIDIVKDMPEEEAKMWLDKTVEEYTRKRPHLNPETHKWEVT